MTFVKADGSTHSVNAYVDQTFLQAALDHGMPIEAACAASCACSTCHVYLDDASYRQLPEPEDKEYDMLDQAFFPKPTSRLACQIKVKRTLSGATVTLPKATRNMAVDGYVAKPH